MPIRFAELLPSPCIPVIPARSGRAERTKNRWTRGWSLVCALSMLPLGGCYSIHMLDIHEGREELHDHADPTSSTATTAMQESISVRLVAPKHMACVLKGSICHMQPIPGKAPKEELKALHHAEPNAAKSMVGLVALDVGEILRAELETELQRHYRHVEVELVEAPAQASTGISVEHKLTLNRGRVHQAASDLNGGAAEGHGNAQDEFSYVHLTWYIPLALVSLWIPLAIANSIHHGIDERVIAMALHDSARDLADTIAKQASGSSPERVAASYDAPVTIVLMTTTASSAGS